MHLVIPFAAPLAEAARHGLQTMALPGLAQLLMHWQTQAPLPLGDEFTLSPPHEQLLAREFNWPGADGRWPWAAWCAQADPLVLPPGPVGLLTPVHLQVGADQVRLLPPALLALQEAESRELLDALAPLLAEGPARLHWGAPTRWYWQHPLLAGLATPALHRVAGRNALPWLHACPQPKPLARLFNEVQMLLHAHPANQRREAAGALPVNALWLSGCGEAPAATGALRLEPTLVDPALAEDWPAWAQAWQALDAQVLAPLQAAGPGTCVSLCGERGVLTLQAGSPRGPAGWLRRWRRPPPAHQALEAL